MRDSKFSLYSKNGGGGGEEELTNKPGAKKIGTKYNKRKSICREEIKGKNKFIYTKVHTKTILLMQKKKEVLTRPWRILHLNNSKGIQENLLFSKSLEKISYS